jgi:hypothetical protein
MADWSYLNKLFASFPSSSLSLSCNFVCNAKIYIVLLLLNLLTCYGNRKMQEESVDVRETRNAEHYGALIHHLSLIRNKRCLMAYV